jgi:hypothetical protein
MAARRLSEKRDLLQGFKLLLQTIDRAYADSIHSAEANIEAKKLVQDYFPIFKKANRRLYDKVSWDEIIDAIIKA